MRVGNSSAKTAAMNFIVSLLGYLIYPPVRHSGTLPEVDNWVLHKDDRRLPTIGPFFRGS